MYLFSIHFFYSYAFFIIKIMKTVLIYLFKKKINTVYDVVTDHI